MSARTVWTCCCFNSPLLTGNELSWCLLWPFEWTVPLLCATPFAVPLTVPFVVPLLFTAPFRCLRSPFFYKQTRFISIYVSVYYFDVENQSRLWHIFLDALVCNEIRDNHMGIIYTVQHYHSNLSIGAIFTIYLRQNHVHIDAVYYIIFSDLQALLMFHFLIISEM